MRVAAYRNGTNLDGKGGGALVCSNQTKQLMSLFPASETCQYMYLLCITTPTNIPLAHQAVRSSEHAIYAQLAADRGKLALALCKGFGQPEKLIATPISTDWRMVGRS